jgi:hypothetical protein
MLQAERAQGVRALVRAVEVQMQVVFVRVPQYCGINVARHSSYSPVSSLLVPWGYEWMGGILTAQVGA